jgi:ATP synthase F0 subunit b
MWTQTFSASAKRMIFMAIFFAIQPAVAFAGEETPNPLAWDKDLAIWSAVVFLVLLGVLYKMAWGPLAEGMSNRERHIADQIAQANAANLQAKELLASHEKKLADAAQEVRAIMDKARQDAEEAAREREAKAEADAKARLERAEKEIAAATAAAAKDLADRSAKLAVDLAGKIVRAKGNRRRHGRRREGSGRPQREAGGRSGGQDRPREAQSERSRPAYRRGRQRLQREQAGRKVRE